MSLSVLSPKATKILRQSVIDANESTVMQYLINKPKIDENKEILRVDKTIKTKDYQEHDIFNLIYQPVPPKIVKKTTWARFLKRLTNTTTFAKLRLIANGNPLLSVWATARVIQSIIEELKKHVDKLPQQPQPGGQGSGQEPTVQDVLDKLGSAELSDVIRNVKATMKQISNELERVKEYQEELEDLASMLGGAGGNWFSHDALSLQKFLENPDEVRKRIRMLRQALTWMRKFNDMISEPKQGSQQSDYFGVKDIAKMSREAQLSRVLSSELAYLAMPDPVAKLMFLSKYAQKELLVYKGYGMSRISVFIDKSGSMADRLDASGVPKISIATGLGLAILQKFKDDAKLYMFDTEVDEVNKSKAIDVLLRIQADGGTNISNVLEEIKKNDDKSTLYLIISDGIDEVNADLDESLKKRIVVFLLNTRVPEWIRKLGIKYYDIRSVADFEHAVKETFSS